MSFFTALKNIAAHTKSIFLSGLFTLIPIAATVFFINFLYGFLANTLQPLSKIEPTFLKDFPGSHFILAITFVFIVGILLKWFVINHIIHYFEKLITRIPLVRIVYSSAKMVVDFFKIPTDKVPAQRQVVLIPYPMKGQYHIAFLLESAEDTYEKIIPDGHKRYPGERYVKVFMPNSPNVTAGYFFIMPADDVIQTTITFEEAIKTLVSCGLVVPESLKNNPQPILTPLLPEKK